VLRAALTRELFRARPALPRLRPPAPQPEVGASPARAAPRRGGSRSRAAAEGLDGPAMRTGLTREPIVADLVRRRTLREAVPGWTAGPTPLPPRVLSVWPSRSSITQRARPENTMFARVPIDGGWI